MAEHGGPNNPRRAGECGSGICVFVYTEAQHYRSNQSLSLVDNVNIELILLVYALLVAVCCLLMPTHSWWVWLHLSR